MLAVMLATPVQLVDMAKTNPPPTTDESGEYRRVPMLLTPEERKQLKLYAIAHGESMEHIGGRWIVERLKAEQAKRRH